MTFNILRVLLLLLPFVIVPNDFDCFRSIKESLFQVGAIVILGASFFDNKLREYHNKYITYFLIYIAITFFYFYSLPYIFGQEVRGQKYNMVISAWHLIPIFNLTLGLLMLKALIENISVKQVKILAKIVCWVTVLTAGYMICQKLSLFQIYGRNEHFTGGNWFSSNRTIGFIGNPMLAGGFVAIGSQFNLLFNTKRHWIFYIICGIATCCTLTVSPPLTFFLCAFIYLIIYKRPIGYLTGILILLGGLVAIKVRGDFFSSSDRIEVWKQTLQAWWVKPYTGMGLGSFRNLKITVNLVRWQEAHNEWLQLLQQIGIIGLGFVIAIMTDFFRRISLQKEVFVCGLVVFAGCINSLMSFPLHIAALAYILILGFGFYEIFQKEETQWKR